MSLTAVGCALVFGLIAISPIGASAQATSLTLSSARVSIAGTSNVHDFTASTTDVRVTKLVLANSAGLPTAALSPGAVEAFEIAVRTKTLSSPKEGIDKNMHKALKADQFADITFRLLRMEGKAGALKATGMLKIAGVERELTFNLKTATSATTLTITGEVPLLMTDYGIAAPKAMVGMLKTDPRITVTFEVVLSAPTTL